MKKHASLLYSAVGLVGLAVILVAFNYLASGAAVRADLTEGRLYTLSEGTKRILAGLEAPVKLKLYVSQGEAVPVPLRGFSKRVEDLVNEFRAASNGKLIVERYHPTPDSETEDAAQLDGVEPQALGNGESFYLGIAVNQLDRKQVIPAVSPQRERLLEYDLARAIALTASAKRPTLGLMAGLPVAGMKFNPMTRQSVEPWVIAGELRRDYDLRQIPLGATTIDKDVNVLLLIHPRDLQPATEYALDQFVLRGGKLIVFVDPLAFFDQQPTMPGMPQTPSSSSLPRLFKAWGIEMAPDKVIADVVYGSGGGARYTPTVLTLNRTAFDRDDVATGQIETLLYAFGGALGVKPVDGLRSQVLVRSSPSSMLVDAERATKSGDEAMRGFEPGNKSWPLAVRLSGTFRTAFPEGRPADPAAKDAKPAAETAPHLATGGKDNAVVVVGDVDMLADGAAVDVQEVLGQKIIVPSNGNLAFALSLVEQVSGGEALASLRSRASAFRTLTVMRELEAEAQKQYFGKIRALEAELQKTNEKLQSVQKATGSAAKGAQIISAAQQKELEAFRTRVIQTKKELKEVRRSLRQDAEAVAFWTKVANIALMPLLVAALGLGVALTRRRRARRALAAGAAA